MKLFVTLSRACLFTRCLPTRCLTARVLHRFFFVFLMAVAPVTFPVAAPDTNEVSPLTTPAIGPAVAPAIGPAVAPPIAPAASPTPVPLDSDAHPQNKTANNDCALTFDDGPSASTGALLDLLAKDGIKATFFVLGEHAHRYPEIIKRMLAEGHDVENHSWDHPDMVKLAPAERQSEIEKTDSFLKELGAQPHYFRPPYGLYDAALVKQAHDDGYEIILWTQDSDDWRYHTVASIENEIHPKTGHGVYLFHDTHKTTIAAMPTLIDDLKKQGCQFTTITQWLKNSPADPFPSHGRVTYKAPLEVAKN